MKLPLKELVVSALSTTRNKTIIKASKKSFSSGKLISLFVMSALSSSVFAQTQIIHAGKLLTIPGKSPLTKQSIIVIDGKISAVETGFVSVKGYGKDAEIIDLSKAFVMPGMMDMHVHLQGQLGPRNDSEKLRESGSYKLVKSASFAKKTLMAGFTSVRDLGGSSEESFALRDGINNGLLDGPRVFAAGTNVAVTGGHGDVDGMNPDLLEMNTAKTVCDGPYDCRRATRRAIKFGADLIKITSTGGVLSDTDTGTGQQMADDELKEVVDAAHALGRKVASHAHAAPGINAALRAGVDSIEHGSYANEESIKLFKESGAYLVPTLMAGDTVVSLAKNTNFMSEAIKAKAIRVGADMIDNFKRSYKSGVKIAYGTDSGVSMHGLNAREAVLMSQAGMSNQDIIISATTNAADLLGKSKLLGSIEKGKFADIIAVDDNPLENINTLLDVNFVMKAGKVYKN